MFKYNEWSDLKNSISLVKPISKTEDRKILCLDENGKECVYEYGDFDLNKKVEDRNVVTIEDVVKSMQEEAPKARNGLFLGEDNLDDEEEEEENNPAEEEKDLIDDSIHDGSEEPPEDDGGKKEYEDTPEGFYYNDAFLKKLNLKKGIFYKDNI